MKFQGKLPIILSVVMLIVLTALSVARIQTLSGPGMLVATVLVVMYAAWILFEGKVAAKEVEKEATGADRGTLELYAAARGLTVILALAAAPVWPSVGLMVLGTGIFAFGVVFRLVAIRQLGRFYSHRVRVTDEHRIIDSGPYGIVRHPAYTGMLVAHLGFVIAFFNWYGLIAFTALLLPSIITRILIEEREMMNVGGYEEYALGHKRLIPTVW